MTNYYVSAAGGGAHDGTSEANAWTFTEAVTANNALGAGGAAGRIYNVKGAHTGRGANDTISVGGTATSPAWWRGYTTTIGDTDNGTRDSYGALDTTNYPDLGYNSTFSPRISAAAVIFTGFDIAVAISGAGLSLTGGTGLVANCRVVNTSTNASATGITIGSAGSVRVVNCDISTGASGGLAGIEVTASPVQIFDCRITTPGCIGIRISQSGYIIVCGNTIYTAGTDGITSAQAAAIIYAYRNTIHGCVDGFDIISTSTAVNHTFVGNHVTDNSGVAVNFNGGTSGGEAVVLGNRFRDNTGGDTSGYADWVTSSNLRNITTDTGGAATDYVDATTNKDFRLISAAPGYRQGFAYNSNIGACGDNVTAGAGGILVNRGGNGGLI